MNNFGLLLLRGMFLAVAIRLDFSVMTSNILPKDPFITWANGLLFLSVIVIALIFIGLDMLMGRKELKTVTAVYFGLIVGLFLTYVVRLAMTPLFPNFEENKIAQYVLLYLWNGALLI